MENALLAIPLIGLVILSVAIFDRMNSIKNILVNFWNLRDDVKTILAKLNEIEKRLAEQEGNAAPFFQQPVPETPEAPAPAERPQITMDEPLEEKETPAPDYITEILDAVRIASEQETPAPEEKEEESIPAEPVFSAANDAIQQVFTPEKKLDLEKYIGENVINKIGIGILVIGIGFFVKYAIDKEWINETFRALIGMFCGAVLIGLAHRLHRKFKAFSSVLVGGGLAVFYLTVSIAFHQYHLFSQTAAFGIMVCITGLAIWLSILYDRKEIAVLAILGGFGTPFFVSNGEGNYKVLFTYLLILNAGMMVLASFRKWPLVNIICYCLTAIIFGGWFTTYDFAKNNGEYPAALLFASAFYLVFFIMNIAYNIRHSRNFKAFDYGILLSNSFLYFWAGMVILSHISQGSLQGLFAAGLSVFNLTAAAILFRNKRADKNLVRLLIGLVVAFVSLTGPIQLHGSYITMYWAAEAALLLYLSQKTGILLLKAGSVIINAAMICSLIIMWQGVYGIMNSEHLYPLINKGFITGAFVLFSLQASMFLSRREAEEFLPGYPSRYYHNLLAVAFALGLYAIPLLELLNQVEFYIKNSFMQGMVISLYHAVYACGLILYGSRRKSATLSIVCLAAGFIILVLYIGLYTGFANGFIEYGYVQHAPQPLPFYIVHLPVLALVLSILYITRRTALALSEKVKGPAALVYWFTAFCIVFMASSELYHLSAFAAYRPQLPAEDVAENVSKIGFPIVWGLCAFIFMRAGLVRKNRTLRIISLTLLLLTVLKLFIFDIRNASEIGKIIAFVCLGAVLLIISFMYQKIRILILKDDITGPEPEANAADNEPAAG